ncbi:hypothetical protein [Hymenobacter sp.]|uniref:hypothetical protein n=1 Tax=Hymenobacter sp. TaxID=1898978 RepID=UPI002EDBA5BF
MRYPHFLALCILFTFWLGGCQKDDNSPTPISELTGRTWLLSYEESQGNVEVYRPDTYVFPPSRGRTGFKLDANNSFTQLDIAPADGIWPRPGKWVLLGTDILFITLDDQPKINYKLHIISKKNDVLKVERY